MYILTLEMLGVLAALAAGPGLPHPHLQRRAVPHPREDQDGRDGQGYRRLAQ